MGRARVTGDRQREKTEDTPMPRACGCRAPSSSAARSPSLSSRFALRAPCSVLRFLPSPTPCTFLSLSLTLSATLRRRAPCLPARLPAPLSLSSFRLLSSRRPRPRVPITSRASSSAPSFLVLLPRLFVSPLFSPLVLFVARSPPPPPALYFFPSFSFPRGPTFLLRFFRIFFCFYLFHLPFHFPRVHFLPPPPRDRARYRLFFTLTFSSPNIRLQFSSFAPFLLYTRPTDLPAYPTPSAAIPAFVAQPLFRRNAVNRNIAKR